MRTTRKSKREPIVRYCPGAACGSPAYLPDSRAKTLLETDTARLGLMAKHSKEKLTDSMLPHIGACSFGCPHYNS